MISNPPVVIVQKAFGFLVIVAYLFLLACHQSKTTSIETLRKPDLKKAALYNVQLGMGYLKQGDRPRAKRKLLIAMQQEPDSPDTNAAMAYYYEQTNEIEQAKKYYLKAVSLSSNEGAQLNNYGTFLCRQGQYKKAELYFLEAVKDENYVHTAGAYENAGLCAQAASELSKAKRYFTIALNQDPTRKTSLYELARIENKQGYNNEALALIQKYPELVLNDKIFLTLAKEIAEKAGKYGKAAEYKNNINKISPHTHASGVNNEYSILNG